MLTDLRLVCRFTWWQTSRGDFKQVFSHLEGEHHWAGRICKLPSAHSDLISQQSYWTWLWEQKMKTLLKHCLPVLRLPTAELLQLLGEDAWICFLSKKNEAICLKAGVCISIYTRCVTFLFFNPVLHFKVNLSKLFLVSMVLVPFLISGGYLS